MASSLACVSFSRRSFSRSTGSYSNKVTVVGAAGGIGQPLSLLFKQLYMAKEGPLIDRLSLYDVAPVTPGVAADLSHIDTPVKVTGFTGDKNLPEALKDSDLVIVPAGVPRKPGMTRDDLFNINAGIVANVAKAIAQTCPNALVLIISNPVNSTVPIVAEVLKKYGVFNPNRLFGVTTLDVVRAATFVAENQKKNARDIRVNVIGGHAGITIIPLLSQVPNAKFSDADRDALTKRIMFGGDEVVAAKAGGGSATLSMAYAGARFAHQVLRAKMGARTLVECSYVSSSLIQGVPYFASPVQLGPNGIHEVHSYGKISEYEQKKLNEAIPELQASIKKGVEFAEAFLKKQ